MSPEQYDEYLLLSHAVQSGVAAELTINSAATPKQLRTGLDIGKAEYGALVALLVEKSLITEEEWSEKVLYFLRLEKKSYEDRLTAHYGKSVTLA